MYIRLLTYGVNEGTSYYNAVADMFFDTQHTARENWFELSKDEADFVRQKTGLKINKAPTISFMKLDTRNGSVGKIIGMIRGRYGKATIQHYYHKALNGELGEGSGAGEIIPTIIKGDGDDLLPGFGLLDLPPLAWLLLSMASGFKAATSKRRPAQIAYGAVGAYGLSQYIKANQKKYEDLANTGINGRAVPALPKKRKSYRGKRQLSSKQYQFRECWI